MSSWDSRYAERVKLLVDVLPTLAGEKRFALKGGTAINFSSTTCLVSPSTST